MSFLAPPSAVGVLTTRRPATPDHLGVAVTSPVAITPSPVEEASPQASNPALVYLASLAPSGRRTMRGRLETVAVMIRGERDLMRVPWQDLRFEHLAALRARLEEQGLSPASVNATLYALRGVAKACWNLGLLGADDLARLKNVACVRGSRLPAGRALSSGELLALLDVCAGDASPAGTRDAALLCVLYSGGVRRAEVVALEVSDYEEQSHSLRVRGKGNKERLVYLSSGAAEAVGDWLVVRQELRASSEGPLFLALLKNGTLCKEAPLSAQAIYNALYKRACEAGVKSFSPHDLRRTFVGDLLERGVDIATVQHLAGHSNVSTTARYDRRGEETKRKAVGVLHVPYKRRSVTG